MNLQFSKHLSLTWVLLLGVLFHCGTLQAKRTEITGNIPGYKGQPVFLLRPTDYVSWNKIPVAMAFTDEKGAFEMQYAHLDTAELLLCTPRQQWPLTVLPGEAYNCLFQPGAPEPHYRGKLPQLNSDLEDLNSVLRTLDASVAGPDPQAEDFAALYQSLLKVQQRYANHPSKWLRIQAKYAVGYNMIEAASRLQQFERMDSLEMALLFASPMHLEHPEYARFIYYTVLNRLSVPTFRHYFRDPLADYGLPMDIMKREIMWYPMELRPLAILMAFKVCYVNNWYKDRASHTTDLRAFRAAISPEEIIWQRVARYLLRRFDTAYQTFPGPVGFCNAKGELLDLKKSEGKWRVLRIRSQVCATVPGLEIPGEFPEDRLQIVEISLEPKENAYAPCNSEGKDATTNWLDDECGRDLVVDPTGQIMWW